MKFSNDIGKFPCSIGNTSSNGPFSIVMLDFGGGVPEITVTLDQQNSAKPFLHTRILNRRLIRPIFGWG